MSDKRVTDLIRAPYQKLIGAGVKRFYGGWDNNFTQKANNAAGTDVLDVLGTDALNNVLVGGSVTKGLATPITLPITTSAKIVTTPIYVQPNDTTPLEVVAIDCTFGTANGAALTAYISKDVAGVAPGFGTSVMSGTFNLNATANTTQSATLAGARLTPVLSLLPGEQLSLKLSTTVTSLAGLMVTIWVRPHTGAAIASWRRSANGDIATSTMYLNIIPGMKVRAVAMRWGTAGSDAGAVTMDITKDTGTNAPGAGTSILSAAQSVKGTANTTVYPSLAASAATLTMAAGDRLAVKTTGTLTALANLVITVVFEACSQDHIAVPFSFWDVANTDRTVLINRTGQCLQVVDCWMTWSTASTSNTQLLTKDTGTTAPGAGTGLQTDNTNAGILTSATANTPVGSLLLSAVSTKPTLWLAPGDRLGIKNAGTVGSLAGVSGVVLLRRA